MQERDDFYFGNRSRKNRCYGRNEMWVFASFQMMVKNIEKLQKKRISNIEEEKKNFLQAVEKGEYARRDWHGWNGEKSIITPAYLYKPVNFEVYGDSVTIADFEKVISSLHKRKGNHTL